jgi:hypothetical protein
VWPGLSSLSHLDEKERQNGLFDAKVNEIKEFLNKNLQSMALMFMTRPRTFSIFCKTIPVV